MDEISTSDFDQLFKLENLFDLTAGLMLEKLKNESLQEALVHRTAPKELASEEYMTTDQVAAYLKRSPNTIRQWCRLDAFPYTVFLPGKGGDRIFSKKMVDRRMEERAFNVPAE